MGDLNRTLAYLKELGFKPDVDRFQDKLVIQKTICLLELLGVDLKYRFSLYIRGPYSPDLTNDLYKNKGLVESLKTEYVLSAKEKELAAKISEASNNLEPTMLEIITTYAYLSVRGGRSSREAITELKKLKPFFSEAKIAVGVSRAKQLFPPSKEEIRRMKAEFAGVEEAAISDNQY